MTVATQLKQLSKDTFFYGLGNTVQKFIGFLLFPLYTRVLTQEDFGAQDLIYTAFAIAFSILILGLDNGAARYYYDVETQKEKVSILSTWLWFGVLLSITLCIPLFVLAEPICTFLFGMPNLASLFILSMASLPFAIANKAILMVLRLTFQSRMFSLVSTLYILTLALLSIFLVVFLDLGVKGIFWANLIAAIVQMGLGLVFTYQHFRFTFSGSRLKAMLAFGLPTVPASLSLWILNSSNRYYLARLATLSDVGLFSVGFRISTIPTFVIAAFLIAWPMFAFSLIKNEELAKQTYSKTLTYFLLICLLTTVTVGIFAREAIRVLATPVYESAAGLIPWLCYGAIAWGAADIVGMGHQIAKKSYHMTVATILGALATTGLNIWLIPIWGITGAAIATMTGNLVALLYNYFTGQYYFFIHYESLKIFTLITLATITIVFGAFIDRNFGVWSPKILLFKILLYLAFGAGLFIFKIITQENVRFVSIYLKTWFNNSFRPAAGSLSD